MLSQVSTANDICILLAGKGMAAGVPGCRGGTALVVGGNASTTTDICFSFSSALRKPFGSSLCFLANENNEQRHK